jgi:hypothetical protein
MRRVLIALVIAGCAGCSGIDNFDQYQDRQLDAECEYLVRCHVVASTADCIEERERTVVSSPNVDAALEAGSLGFDRDAAQACIDAFDDLSCDRTEQQPDTLAICDDVLTGKLGNGASCGFAEECTSGRCLEPACESQCCLGMCAPSAGLPDVGEACTVVCVDGAYCGVDSTCHVLLPAGAACDGMSICDDALYCAGLTTTGSGVCTALPHEGEACENACAELSSVCLGGVCQRLGLAGDPCEANTQCSSFYSCTGGTCGGFPALGDACSTVCEDGAFCDDATCAAQKPNGEACIASDECSSHYCDRGTCADIELCI